MQREADYFSMPFYVCFKLWKDEWSKYLLFQFEITPDAGHVWLISKVSDRRFHMCVDIMWASANVLLVNVVCHSKSTTTDKMLSTRRYMLCMLHKFLVRHGTHKLQITYNTNLYTICPCTVHLPHAYESRFTHMFVSLFGDSFHMRSIGFVSPKKPQKPNQCFNTQIHVYTFMCMV